MAESIDVIIPVYNDKEGLLRCLNSLDNQKLDRDWFKVIVVDDGSQDPITLDIFEGYNLNIILDTHERNKGLPSALNTALSLSNSRYFVRIDSDDYVHEMFLTCLLLAFSCDHSTVAVACDYKLVDEYENHIKNQSFREKPIGCGIMFKRIILQKIGLYNTEFILAEEVEFMKRFTEHFSLKYIEIPLYRYTQRKDSLSSDKARYSSYIEKALNR